MKKKISKILLSVSDLAIPKSDIINESTSILLKEYINKYCEFLFDKIEDKYFEIITFIENNQLNKEFKSYDDLIYELSQNFDKNNLSNFEADFRDALLKAYFSNPYVIEKLNIYRDKLRLANKII